MSDIEDAERTHRRAGSPPAFQDDTIETLNQTITAQWKQIDALTRQIAALNERLQEAERRRRARPTSVRRIIESQQNNGLRMGGRYDLAAIASGRPP